MRWGAADMVKQRRFIEESDAGDVYKRVVSGKLDELVGLCETVGCRRVELLAYFGESATPCGNCDNCLNPPSVRDATAEAQKALSCVYRTGQRFGVAHLIDVLRGADTEKIRRFGHHELGVYSIGQDTPEAVWRGVFRQLISNGFLEVDHESFGVLKLTAAAKPLLKGEQKLMLREYIASTRTKKEKRERERARSKIGDVELSGAEQVLLDRLRAWRRATAAEHGVPAYVILHDASLNAVVQKKPQRSNDLHGILGLGETKRERYGEALLTLVREWAMDSGEA